jgi:hypothetical protein
MKKIISVFILTLASFFVFASNEPKLDLVVYYNNTFDSSYVKKLFTDNDICCRFDIIYIKSTESKMVLLNGKTKNVLGTIYGLPNQKFLTDIYFNIYKAPNEIVGDKK